MTPTGPEYRMHHYSEATDRLADAIFGAARKRISEEPVPLDSTATEAQLEAAAGPTITPAGIGGHEALRQAILEDIGIARLAKKVGADYERAAKDLTRTLDIPIEATDKS